MTNLTLASALSFPRESWFLIHRLKQDKMYDMFVAPDFPGIHFISLLFTVNPQTLNILLPFQERIKIFSNPFRPITKAKQGLIRIACVLTLALVLFVPPLFLAYYELAGYLKLFTKLLQPSVLIIGQWLFNIKLKKWSEQLVENIN